MISEFNGGNFDDVSSVEAVTQRTADLDLGPPGGGAAGGRRREEENNKKNSFERTAERNVIEYSGSGSDEGILPSFFFVCTDDVII